MWEQTFSDMLLLNIANMRVLRYDSRTYDYILVDKDGNELSEKAYSLEDIRKIMATTNREITHFCLNTYSNTYSGQKSEKKIDSRLESIEYLNSELTIRFHEEFLVNYVPRNAPIEKPISIGEKITHPEPFDSISN